MNTINENYNISKDELWTVIDTYFKTKGLVKHQIESFDEFLNIKINKIISDSPPVEVKYNLTDKSYILHTIKFKNTYITKPQVIERDNTVTALTPNDSRLRNLTYESSIFVNIEYKQQKVIDTKTEVISCKSELVNLCNIPIMVGSSYCITNGMPKKGLVELQECEYDQGGYFIVNGNEKVLVAQERMATNNVYVFLNKINNYVAEIRSIQEGDVKSANQILIKYVKPSKKNNIVNENIFRVCLPYVKKEIPLIVLFKALGIVDNDIIKNLIDKDNIDLLEPSLEEGEIIASVEQAIEYIGKRATYTLDTKEKRNDFVTKLLSKDILAHIELIDNEKQTLFNKKALFIGYMTNKLILTIKGKRELDDRDHWGNKRVDLSSNLLGSLFRASFSRVLKEFKIIAEKHILLGKHILLTSDINKNAITRDIKYALSTGNWTVNKQKITKTGVSQVLSRLSYLSTLSHLRRIVAPIAKDGKSAKPRQLHNTSYGICCVTGDTKVLLSDGITTKNISELTENNTVMTTSSYTLEEEPSKIYNYFKKEQQDIITITTLSGRSLKCTKDHPLLIKNNSGFEWKLAGECKEGDRVIIKHTIEQQEGTQTMYISKDDFLKKINKEDYANELVELNLIDKNISQSKLSVISRLLGLSVTDGHLSCRNDNNYSVEFYLGEEQDAYNVVDDLLKLGVSHFSIKRTTRNIPSGNRGKGTQVSTWDVLSSGSFSSLLYFLGSFEGKKNTQERHVPSWIKEGSLQTIQNYLIGFQSGDGGYMSYQKNIDCYKRHLVSTVQICSEYYLENTTIYMNEIASLFNRFNIECKVVNYKVDDTYSVNIKFSDNTINLKTYTDLIYYRYSYHKQRRSKITIEQIYSCYNTQKDRQEQYNKVYELSQKKSITERYL